MNNKLIDSQSESTQCSRVTPPQTDIFVINHIPPCRSKPVKALFDFGNTIKDILDENQEACDCPYWLPSK